jgi:FHS family L-fucose permease-like MFS transporter
MAAPTVGPASSGSSSAPVGSGAKTLQLFVFALFFIFGGITSLNDVLIPKLKDLFTLSYAEAMLVQSAFFFAYFTISMPAASLVQRIGYMRTGVVGLVVMLVGCLLFIPAAASALFPAFLAALFVLAAGITTVQVVANPLISMLGDPKTAHSRLTFAQAFNSLGTTIFPIVGSSLILGSLTRVDPATLSGDQLAAYQAQEAYVVGQAYLGLAVALGVVAAAVWIGRKLLVEEKAPAPNFARALGLLKRKRLAFGALCIFLYVGAEVAVGSVIVNYLMQDRVMGLDERTAGQHIAFYWGGALVGRFIGAAILRQFNPGKVLACFAAGSITLLLVSGLSSGTVSGWALLAVGLCNSIMFPTIFTLACEGLGVRAAEGSGIICVAIVGGAVVPPLTGALADVVGLQLSLILPAVCYGIILLFGLYARRPAEPLDEKTYDMAPPVV